MVLWTNWFKSSVFHAGDCEFESRRDYFIKTVFDLLIQQLEVWQSGLLHRSWKPEGVNSVPGVRIPQPPQIYWWRIELLQHLINEQKSWHEPYRFESCPWSLCTEVAKVVYAGLLLYPLFDYSVNLSPVVRMAVGNGPQNHLYGFESHTGVNWLMTKSVKINTYWL